jgi:membrane-associated protease RseP (regulator of RpoE activity)
MTMIGGTMICMNVAPVQAVAGAGRSGRTDKHTRRRGAVLLGALMAGALLGPLDLAGQVHSPYPYANLFNSPAVWAAAAFVFGRWANDVVPAVLGAIVVMVVGVETYYATDVLVRGANASNLWSTVALVWLMLGVGAGVSFGAAGALSARTGTWAGSAASATLPAVFVSEAAHEATTSGEVGWIVLVIVIAAVTTLWLLRRADRTSVQRTMLCLAAWSALGFVAYLPFG